MVACVATIIKKVMSRVIEGDWISAYLKYTEDTESPTSYHIWTAISLIAGALQRKCSMQWGLETIYPNMFIILVGSAGRTRKSLAINIGQEIFKALDLPVISEAITPEALLVKMQKTALQYIDPQGLVHTHASLTCFSKELVTLLGHGNYKFLGYLTDWWDAHDKWDYETIARKEESVLGMYLNILGATTPDWIGTMLPVEAIGGGFTSRCIFIVETSKAKHIPLPVFTTTQAKLKQALIHDLDQIALIQGNYEFEKDTSKIYKEWYTTESKSMENEEYPIEDPRFRAYCERRSTMLRKICIILQASENDSLRITTNTWHRALALLQKTEQLMPDVFGGLGRSDQGQLTYELIQYIGRKKIVGRETVFKHFYRHMSWRTYIEIEDALRNMNLIDVDPKTKTITYTGD